MRAQLVGAEIEFDETARSPCYHYFDKMRREHVVWFEDARSLRAKIALAAEKGLQGIGFWQAGRELAQAWPLLDALVTLETL
jgi:spore germination protein